jgi:long-chain acyl-CoA synthetase
MEASWLKHYPSGIQPSIDLSSLPSITDVFAKVCHKYASQPAVTCMGTDLSFHQLDLLSQYFAAYLQQNAGLKKGDRCAIMLPNIIQFPVVFLACQKIGVICVNTNPLYTPREMEHQFHDSGVKAIVILDLMADKLEQIISKTSIQHVIVTSIGEQLPFYKGWFVDTVLRIKGLVPKHQLTAMRFRQAIQMGQSLKLEQVQIKPDDIAILQYTGGTTGLSKGAMLTQRNILANMEQIRLWASPVIKEGGGNVALTAIPLYHIFALTVNFLAFLRLGSRMILVPKPIPIENTAIAFRKYPINIMTGVNTLYNALNHSPVFQKLAPRTLKVALAGGMALQSSVSKAWRQITGIAVTEGFGLTESSPVTHCNLLDGTGPANSIGLPLPSTEAKICDEQGNEVEIGGVGELVVRGPQVMMGYWQKPEETAKVLREGWLWTGDIAKRDHDGFFYIVDRKKDMILVSGFNVYPNEVEEVIAGHPKVLEVAVVGVPDETSGEIVKAFVVKKDSTLHEDEIREFARKELTNYKCPKLIEFRDALPKSNIGKILRRELREKKS